jgi:hypothetical protein
MNLKTIIYTSILLTTVSCNLFTTDINQETTHTIKDSKQIGVFITAYKCKQDDNDTFKIKEAWVEYAWINDVSNIFIVRPKKIGGLKFNLVFTNYDDSVMYSLNSAETFGIIKPNDFKVLVKQDSLFLGGWSQGAVKTYYLKGQNIPENIYLFIAKKDSVFEKKENAHPYRELILSRE